MNARILMAYLMELFHVACTVFEKVGKCCNGFAEDKHLAEGRSYHNSFRLRLGYWVVPMILWDT